MSQDTQDLPVDEFGREVWVHSIGHFAGERCTSPRMVYPGGPPFYGRCLEHDRQVERRDANSNPIPF